MEYSRTSNVGCLGVLCPRQRGTYIQGEKCSVMGRTRDKGLDLLDVTFLTAVSKGEALDDWK